MTEYVNEWDEPEITTIEVEYLKSVRVGGKPYVLIEIQTLDTDEEAALEFDISYGGGLDKETLLPLVRLAEAALERNGFS